MQERIAAPVLLVVALSGLLAQHSVPAAVGDPAEFLDVHVHQLPGRGHFVSDRRGPAYRQPGRSVDMGQLRHPVPGQHPADRGTRDAQVVADPVRSPLPGEPQRDDPPLGPAWQPGRHRARPRAAVSQRQPRPIPGSPPRRRRRGDLEPLGRAPHGPPIPSYQQGKTTPPLRCQGSISVNQGDLRSGM